MKDKVAVITGAAGVIGEKIVQELLSRGLKVIATDINKSALEKLERALIDKQNLYIDILDVRKVDKIKEFFQKSVKKHGEINYLINNAGVVMAKGIDEITYEDWKFVMDINLTGTFFCMQQAFKIMKENKNGGKILNMSSIAGETGGFKISPNYAASKAGVIAITKSFAKHGGPHGITVNAIAPGTVKSSMSENFETEEIIKNTPLGRLASPKEIAQIAGFMLSEKADYINGATIDVNGGVYLR